MKIIELLNVQPVIQQMIDRKMPSKLAYGLAKNFRMIGQELEDYDKTRINILAAHWRLDPKTNQYKIPKDDQEKWRSMHNELLEAESGYEPFKVDFGLTEKMEMTPGEILALRFMFDNLDLGPDPAPAPVPAAAPARSRSKSKAQAAAPAPAA